MFNIDKYAYSSKLRFQNPMEKLFCALLTLGVSVWADSIYISLLILCIMSWLTIKKGGTSPKIFLRLLLIPISFLIIGMIPIAFSISKDANRMVYSFSVFQSYIGISKIGAMQAIKIFFRSLGAISCLYYLSINTPMIDLLSALKRLGCPRFLVELMGLTYRFIFIIFEISNTMFIAQSSRLGYSNLKNGFRSMGALVSTMFIRSYKHAEDLYTALEARGYNGELNVLEGPYLSSFGGYIIPMVFNLLLIMATLRLREFGGGVL